MPTYEYECEACGLVFERKQAITEDPLRECPECGMRVHRIISGGAGFMMKGSNGGREEDRSGCSLEERGRTCCGRDERCGHPACGEEI